CDRPRNLGAARIWDHAERTKLVAAFLYGDEGGNAAGADRIRLRRRQEAELVLDRKLGLQRAAVAPGAREQLRQMMIALRADHDIDHRRAADDFLALGLRDATGHRDVDLTPIAR